MKESAEFKFCEETFRRLASLKGDVAKSCLLASAGLPSLQTAETPLLLLYSYPSTRRACPVGPACRARRATRRRGSTRCAPR